MGSLFLLGLLSLAVAFTATRFFARWPIRLAVSTVFAVLAPYALLALVSAVHDSWGDLVSPELFVFLLTPWLFCFGGAGIGIGLGWIAVRARHDSTPTI
jgi:hypothetical protein